MRQLDVFDMIGQHELSQPYRDMGWFINVIARRKENGEYELLSLVGCEKLQSQLNRHEIRVGDPCPTARYPAEKMVRDGIVGLYRVPGRQEEI